MNKNKFRLFYLFFMIVLYAGYFMVHGLPQNLQEVLYASLAIGFLASMIIFVFIVTSVVFGLRLHKILKQINNK